MNGPTGASTRAGGDRWRARPVAAFAVRCLVVALPVAAAVGAAFLTSSLLGNAGTGWRVTAVLAASLLALLVVERAARRLLPLSALLSLGLLFPDTAPRRLELALRAGSTRELVRVRQGEGAAADAAAQVLQLLAALARHDPGSRRHSERVRAYVDLLADTLRLPPGDRDRLRWAALVHDLGKTAVDPQILRKPGRLDAQEWRIVREHPAAGERVAAGLRDFLGPWFAGIGQHHERWDGSGYPQGLAGQDIAYAARIMAVADALEVMTASRPYKLPLDPATAREELVRCGGSQFDPEVVRALLGVPLASLRRVVGPLALLGVLPLLGGRLPDPEQVVRSGSDASLPQTPPAPDTETTDAVLVGLHPQAALPADTAVASGAVPSGHDAGGSLHYTGEDAGGASVDVDQR